MNKSILNKLIAIVSVVAVMAMAAPAVFASGGGGAVFLNAASGGTVKKSAVAATPTTTTTTTTSTSTTAAQNAAATTLFLDIKTHWAVQYIEALRTLGVVSGKTATSFAPDAPITRAEVVKIAVNAFKIAVDANAVSPFGDVSKDDWSRTYIAAAKKAGFIGGYPDGTFKPNDYVNRVEALKMLLAAAGKNVTGAPISNFPDVAQAAWYAQYVNWAADEGLVKGYADGKFGIDFNMTRAEFSKIASMLITTK